ncbi:MAG: vanadium-dependent haloperoxidase [Gemmatimonadota bacterium]
MRSALGCVLVWSLTAAGASATTPDIALELNEVVVRVMAAARVPLPDQARTLLFAHVAMFDAINAIEAGRYSPYVVLPAPPAGASAADAALGAVCGVLLAHHAAHRAAIESECRIVASRFGVEPGSASARYGERAGHALIEARAVSGTPDPYRPATTPGVYVPTTLPVGWEARTAQPLAMRAPDQFRPGPPPALSSAVWARDYNETRRVGSRDSTARTEEQTRVARDWAVSGVTIYNPVIRQAAAVPGTLVERARVFALAYIALADSTIAVFDAKYAYNFWRPLTAIRNGDVDGNDSTERDAAWMPLVDAPMHPEYPCAHCISAAALGEILVSVLGDGALATPLTMSAPAAQPGAPKRSWMRVADFVAEPINARIWGGVHFRNSAEVGAAMGRQVGRHTLETVLVPR